MSVSIINFICIMYFSSGSNEFHFLEKSKKNKFKKTTTNEKLLMGSYELI